jgi:hypothetical protein
LQERRSETGEAREGAEGGGGTRPAGGSQRQWGSPAATVCRIKRGGGLAVPGPQQGLLHPCRPTTKTIMLCRTKTRPACLQVLWQLLAAGVAGVHGDEEADARVQGHSGAVCRRQSTRSQQRAAASSLLTSSSATRKCRRRCGRRAAYCGHHASGRPTREHKALPALADGRQHAVDLLRAHRQHIQVDACPWVGVGGGGARAA